MAVKVVSLYQRTATLREHEKTISLLSSAGNYARSNWDTRYVRQQIRDSYDFSGARKLSGSGQSNITI